MEQESTNEKHGEVDLLFKLIPEEVYKIRTKKQVIKRLTNIERLGKQKNGVQIEKLLEKNSV